MITAVTNYFNRQSEKDDVTHSIFRNVGASIVKFTEDKRQKMNTNSVADEVKRCQQLAVECGARKDSVEMFACWDICKDKFNREFFCNLDDAEARMAFLKRCFKKENLD